MSVKVVGVTFNGRQDTIKKLQSTPQQVRIVPEPENKYDRNAIRVETESGEHLGYLPKDITRSVKLTSHRNVDYTIVGGGTYNYGLRLKL